MTNSIEDIILHSLIHDEKYTRKVIAFLKGVYFDSFKRRFLFESIQKYFDDYNVCPTLEILSIDISNSTSITDEQESDILGYLSSLSDISHDDLTEQWLLDSTEKFCQEKAVHHALFESISIMNGENNRLDRGSIPKILSDALAVSFDANVGHDYVENTDERYMFYHHKEKKIPFDLESMNKITKGGFSTKTLNVFAAATGAGKSLVMCHMAAANLSMGYNVLYITMEMAEERIAERIDANLLDVDINTLEEIPKALYDRKVNRMKENVKGKLFIKEYPTAGANVNHFRSLVDELKIKKNFVPDIIYIDYMNICSSSRLKMGSSVNTYTYVKSIAEELRGFAAENECPIISATQFNRTASTDSDPGMDGTSDSFGTVFTTDFFAAIISSEEFQEKGVYLIKQLKNRYNDPTFMRRFQIGVEYKKMRLYEVQNPIEGLYEENIKDSEDSFPRQKRRSSKFDNVIMD